MTVSLFSVLSTDLDVSWNYFEPSLCLAWTISFFSHILKQFSCIAPRWIVHIFIFLFPLCFGGFFVLIFGFCGDLGGFFLFFLVKKSWFYWWFWVCISSEVRLKMKDSSIMLKMARLPSISVVIIIGPPKLFAKTVLPIGYSFLMEKWIISFYLKLTEFPT